MKQHLIIVLLALSIPVHLFCQSWFENSPVWSNRVHHAIKGLGTEYCSILGDTMVGGVQAKICQRVRYHDNWPPYFSYRFLYQTGDSILVWDNNQYVLLYDMSLTPGQSITIKRYDGDTIMALTVQQTGTINLNGQVLRTQNVTGSNNSSGYWEGMMIEKIGAVWMRFYTTSTLDTVDLGTHFFLHEPNNLALDGIDWRFCHYTSDILEYEQEGGDCDLIWTDTEGPITDHLSVTVYPNPATNMFYYDHFEEGSITMVGLDGRIVLQTLTNTSRAVDIRSIPAGTYLVYMANASQVIVVKLVIV